MSDSANAFEVLIRVEKCFNQNEIIRHRQDDKDGINKPRIVPSVPTLGLAYVQM